MKLQELVKNSEKLRKNIQEVHVCEQCGEIYFAKLGSQSKYCYDCRKLRWVVKTHTPEACAKRSATRLQSAIEHGGKQNPYKQMPDGTPVHRFIVEQALGRKLAFNECVHHINGDKRDNQPENLEVVDRSTHTTTHMLRYWANRKAKEEAEKKPAIICPPGKLFELKPVQ